MTDKQLDFLRRTEAGIDMESDYNADIAQFFLGLGFIYYDLPNYGESRPSVIRIAESGKAYLQYVDQQIKQEADSAAAKKADRNRELFWRIMAFVSPFILFALEHYRSIFQFLKTFFGF